MARSSSPTRLGLRAPPWPPPASRGGPVNWTNSPKWQRVPLAPPVPWPLCEHDGDPIIKPRFGEPTRRHQLERLPMAFAPAVAAPSSAATPSGSMRSYRWSTGTAGTERLSGGPGCSMTWRLSRRRSPTPPGRRGSRPTTSKPFATRQPLWATWRDSALSLRKLERLRHLSRQDARQRNLRGRCDCENDEA